MMPQQYQPIKLPTPTGHQQAIDQQRQHIFMQQQPQTSSSLRYQSSAPSYIGVPSSQTQGVYTSYPARLLQSEDNALLLPSSYLRRTGGGSDDEFDDNDSEVGSRTTTPITSSTRSRTLTTKMETEIDVGDDFSSSGGQMKAIPVGVAKEYMNLPKNMRTKSQLLPSQQDIDRAAAMNEVLVPIRLDIDVDDVKLRDVFLWNMNEQFLTPEKFAELLCQDINLEPYRYVPLIAESIRTQVMDFEAIYDIELPMENHVRVVINLDLQVGKVNLRDRFEWDLNNTSNNAPEVFSQQMAAELGLGGEYVPIISHAIREQVYRHKRQMVDDYVTDGGITEPLSSAFRNVENAAQWTPQMEILSNEELEKLLVAQERNIRRLRRENRFKRSRRRGSIPRTSGSNTGTPS
ncbi:uncharacterized protein BX664DRAFT_385381 [Halteromyces radiatus]|uniref:uncharacterized protein n=1 Tax=Halteromyces radiatus TaxID=101107 RepID=UPI00221F22E3|nr:uncharacterized protein BX664DRAFT_385381 [Halteromyces radiatus]KAI8088776.1 hypothetical protein BX664DRAFT_385381 [Halteromyces radiatus]